MRVCPLKFSLAIFQVFFFLMFLIWGLVRRIPKWLRNVPVGSGTVILKSRFFLFAYVIFTNLLKMTYLPCITSFHYFCNFIVPQYFIKFIYSINSSLQISMTECETWKCEHLRSVYEATLSLNKLRIIRLYEYFRNCCQIHRLQMIVCSLYFITVERITFQIVSKSYRGEE
jgi:hypothetical protein